MRTLAGAVHGAIQVRFIARPDWPPPHSSTEHAILWIRPTTAGCSKCGFQPLLDRFSIDCYQSAATSSSAANRALGCTGGQALLPDAGTTPHGDTRTLALMPG